MLEVRLLVAVLCFSCGCSQRLRHKTGSGVFVNVLLMMLLLVFVCVCVYFLLGRHYTLLLRSFFRTAILGLATHNPSATSCILAKPPTQPFL